MDLSRFFSHSAVLLAVAGCARRAPEQAVAPPSPTAAPAAVVSATAASPRDSGDAGAPLPSAAPPSPSASPAPIDPLRAPDGTPLPQLDTRPDSSSAAFRERMELLVRAIATDDPAPALPAFFPLVAYEQVKDIRDPARDWQRRLVAAFERNVHEYHRSLGKGAGELRLLGVEVPEAGVRFMKPGSEGNRVGYFRVLRARLRVEDGAGKPRTFEITSLISWRGEWYVVHLNGFQ